MAILNWFFFFFRIGRKKTCLRSQIYTKITQSNDYDSRKHLLKYFSLKCHNWWEQNQTNFLFGVIRFFTIFLWADGRSISNFNKFVSLCIRWITKALNTASNDFLVMSLWKLSWCWNRIIFKKESTKIPMQKQ